jgi:capsular polysaccharide biosynthesis protein
MLDEIGLRTGTDKSTRSLGYLPLYEQVFGHLRDERFEMVEFGVGRGESLATWTEYFSQASFIGVDPSPSALQFASERVAIRVGDVTEPGFLEELATSSAPTVVIDDGSHRWKDQVETFRALYPAVQQGGYYVLQAAHTSFSDEFVERYGDGYPERPYDYLAGIVQGITAANRAGRVRDEFEKYCRDTTVWALFGRQAVILKKKEFTQRLYFRASVRELGFEATRTPLGEPYDRVPAKVTGASPTVRQALESLIASSPVTYEDAVSGDLPDITVVGSGLALTRDGQILQETLNGAHMTRYASGMYRPYGDDVWANGEPISPERHFPVREDGRSYVLLKNTWDTNYGHWLVDVLPKLGLLKGFKDVADCIFVLNTQADRMRQVVLDSLALVGIPEDDALFLDRRTYTFERLTVLGTLTHHPVTKSRFAMEFLESLAEAVPPEQHSPRVYLSRNAWHVRRLVNEDEVIDVVSALGYDVVHAENLDLRSQIARFRSVTHVIGNKGAAMTNLAFAPPGVNALALATPAMEHDFFYDIVCHKHGRYRGLSGTSADSVPTFSSDFRVDLDQLRECLQWLHATAAE